MIDTYALDFSGDNSILTKVRLPNLNPNELLIENRAVGVNRADLMQRDGNYPPPSGASRTLGLEISGLVVHKGAEVGNVRIGDEVCALVEGGAYAHHTVARESTVFAKPRSMDFESAAGIPEAFITAYQAIFVESTNHVRNGILIHAAASGVGMAAIQLAKLNYTFIVATASSSKHSFCKALGADRVVDYKSENFIEALLHMERQIDLIIDPVGAPYLDLNLKLLRTDGCLVCLAVMGGYKADLNLLSVLLKRLSLVGTTLRSRSTEYKKDLIQSFTRSVLPKFDEGLLKVYVDRTFTFDQVDKAHDYMRANKNKGKIILTP